MNFFWVYAATIPDGVVLSPRLVTGLRLSKQTRPWQMSHSWHHLRRSPPRSGNIALVRASGIMLVVETTARSDRWIILVALLHVWSKEWWGVG